MTSESSITMDFYPSRVNENERIVVRTDPVLAAFGSAPAGLLQEHADNYREAGFALIRSFFSDIEIRRFALEADRLAADDELLGNGRAVLEPGSTTLRSIFDLAFSSEIFAELIHDERLLNWARYILGDDVYIHQSRLNFKPAFEGESFYWHSDFETWHVEDGMPRMRALSVSIALNRNLTTNGPVMAIPGSHLHYVSCSGKTPEQNHVLSLRRQEVGVPSHRAITELVSGSGIYPVTCDVGDVLFFDCNLMHGSSANITPFPRNNLFIVYNALGNRLRSPYSGMKPRPEWIAHRRAMSTPASAHCAGTHVK
jgi:ectoine hydroxylase